MIFFVNPWMPNTSRAFQNSSVDGRNLLQLVDYNLAAGHESDNLLTTCPYDWSDEPIRQASLLEAPVSPKTIRPYFLPTSMRPLGDLGESAGTTDAGMPLPYYTPILNATVNRKDETAALYDRIAVLEEEKAILRSQLQELAERNHELEVIVAKLHRQPEHAVADMQNDVEKLLGQVPQRVAEFRDWMRMTQEDKAKSENDCSEEVDKVKQQSEKEVVLSVDNEEHRRRKRVKLKCSK